MLTGAASASGSFRACLRDVGEVCAFPPQLAAVQQDDRHAVGRATGRGVLRVRVSAGGEQVDLVTCHLKSKLLIFPGGRFSSRDEGERARFGASALYRRAAEAVTVRSHADGLLDGHGRERPVIVLGELNDEPLAATTEILLGPPGSEFGTGAFEQPDQGNASRLWNLERRIEPASRSFSRVVNGPPS